MKRVLTLTILFIIGLTAGCGNSQTQSIVGGNTFTRELATSLVHAKKEKITTEMLVVGAHYYDNLFYKEHCAQELSDAGYATIDTNTESVTLTEKAAPYFSLTKNGSGDVMYSITLADSPVVSCTGITPGVDKNSYHAEIVIKYTSTPIGKILCSENSDFFQRDILDKEGIQVFKAEYRLYDDGWRFEREIQ